MTTFLILITACTIVGLSAIVILAIAIFKQDKLMEESPKPNYNLIVDTKLSLDY